MGVKAVPPILAVLAIVLLLIGGYVGGYFWLGQYDRYSDISRSFRYAWMRTVYAPCGWCEAKLKRKFVSLRSRDDPFEDEMYPP